MNLDQNTLNLLRPNLEKVAKFIISRSIEEIETQGHIINVNTTGYSETGKESFDFKLEIQGNQILLHIVGNDYFLDMDTGTPAGEIDWRPSDIIEFGKIIYPGLSEDAVLGRLEGLKKYQQVVGVPSPRSYNYTQNGRRTNWTEFAIINKENDIEQLLDLFSIVDQLANRTVDQIRQTVN